MTVDLLFITKLAIPSLVLSFVKQFLLPLFSASKQDEASAHNTSQSTSVSDLARLPKAPDDGSASSESSLSFQEVKYRDGGAHWYRSSAVMLASHK